MEQHKISRLLRNIRTLQLISFAAQCAILTGIGLLTWRLARDIEQQYLWSSPFLLSIVAGAVLLFLFSRSVAWIISRSDRANAAEVDRLYNLKDRLTTYMELRDGAHPFLEPLIRETSPKIKTVSALRSSGATNAIAFPATLIILLGAALLTLPYAPVPDTIIARKEEQKRIAEKGKELEEFVRKLEKQKVITPELKQLSNELRKLSQQLQKPSPDKAEALKKLNEIEQKQTQIHSAAKQSLANDLTKSWKEAAQSEPKAPGLLSDSEKATMEQLARDFQTALEGEEPLSGAETQKLNQGQFSSQDLKKLKEALKKYQDQKSRADDLRAQMQKALDNTRKGTSSGKRTYVADSHLKDREVEKGKGGVEDGPGTTNQDTGPSHFDTKKKQNQEYIEDRTRAEYERRYEGERTNAGKEPLFIQSQWDENANPQYTRVRSFGLQSEVGKKNGTAGKITKQSQDESAIRKERIPASHQQIVKEYFKAIEE